MTAPMTATTSTTTNVTMPAPTSYHPVTPAAPAFDYSDYPVLEKRIAVRATPFSLASLENEIDGMDITARTRGVVFQSFTSSDSRGGYKHDQKVYVVADGSTILHVACEGWGVRSISSRDIELISRHRDIGKIINAVDNLGRTPFYLAVMNRASIKILRLLLAAGAFPDVQPAGSICNSLHLALGFSHMARFNFGYDIIDDKKWALAAITIIKGTFSPSKQEWVRHMYETLEAFPKPLISICADYVGCGLERVVQLVNSPGPSINVSNPGNILKLERHNGRPITVKWAAHQWIDYRMKETLTQWAAHQWIDYRMKETLTYTMIDDKQTTEKVLKILSSAGGADKPINPDQLRIELVEAEASLDPVGFHLPVD